MNTRIQFLEELTQLRHDLLAMATKVEENLGKALAALRNNDAELAKKTAADDKAVDIMQLKIEDEAAIVIATQQPVARDLRELMTIFKLTGNIERVGDHAAHLAKAAVKLSKAKAVSESSVRLVDHLERMAETGQEMLRLAVSAFLEQDSGKARNAAKLDDIIDAEHKALTEEVLILMKENSRFVKKAVRILNTSNQLERMGDHITNICEAIIYMTEGRHEELNA